jgi:hypothetical protein
MMIRIERGKGGKERDVMLSEQLLGILRTYWRLARTDPLAVPRARPEPADRAHNAARRLPSARAAAGIDKKVTVRILRHSFAIHLLESGVDIRIIEVLFGHAHLSTTTRYTHVSQIVIRRTEGPFERIRLEVMPTHGVSDSRRGFPKRSCRDSSWKTGEGFPWRRRSSFEASAPVTICGGWLGAVGMRSRFGGCWRWQ